jgi:YD repeat-containing protein
MRTGIWIDNDPLGEPWRYGYRDEAGRLVCVTTPNSVMYFAGIVAGDGDTFRTDSGDRKYSGRRGDMLWRRERSMHVPSPDAVSIRLQELRSFRGNTIVAKEGCFMRV